MDSIFLYIESNGIFAVLLIVLLLSAGKSKQAIWEEKLFRRAMLLNLGVLIVDTFCWIFDGYIALNTLWINKIIYCAYYILTVAFVYEWMLYTICKLQANHKKVKKWFPISSVPVIVAVAMAIVSLWTGSLYRFDEQGVYIRGELFLVHTGIIWIYFCFVMIYAGRAMARKDRGKLTKEGYAIFISIIFPVVGGLFQTLYYGLNMAWTGSCISFVLMFISIQNKQMLTDALTGVYNRGALEKYINETILHMADNRLSNKLYLVMCDVNKFKTINDTYGHIAGDKALVEVANALNNVCKKEGGHDYLARYGGDEFVIVCKRASEEQIKRLAESIHEESTKVQGKVEFDFPVTLSIGWAEYDGKGHPSTEELIAEADKNMYIDKEMSKQSETNA